jgi:hypothetical protein
MDLYVVIDTKGSGRILGVFDEKKRADLFVERFPNYYKLHTCRLNRINPEILDWADDEQQRATLKRLIEEG